MVFYDPKSYFRDFPTYGAPLSELISMMNDRIDLGFFLNESYNVPVYGKFQISSCFRLRMELERLVIFRNGFPRPTVGP